jgi:hypothetical protein
MDNQRISLIFAAGLLVIGLLSACNLGSRVTNQANQVDEPTVAPMQVQPTPAPSPSANAAQPTVNRAAPAKQPAGVANTKPPTPTVAPAVQSNSKNQGDDLEQQLNQLLNDLDHTDTVNDAGK